MIIHSFLLIGQSNAAGRGFIPEAEPIDGKDILVLRNGRWQPFYRPLNNDRSFSGVSLIESFAEKYAKEHGVKVGIIPCADGGTRLDQWEQGSLLYDNAVYQTRLAKRTSTVAGILWHQGESDCRKGLWQTYEERLIDFFAKFKKDAGLEGVPTMLGALGDYLSGYTNNSEIMENYTKINAALERAAGRMERTAFVSDNRLPCNPDNLHFSAKGLYEFGLRYYDAFLTVEDKDRVFPDMPDMDFANRTEMEGL